MSSSELSAAPTAQSPRLEWAAVPAAVRAWAERELGSPIVRATTQLGGFSPGAAARVVCADGTRAFVKACGSTLNPDTPGLMRAEIDALAVLPSSVPHARLLSAYDDGTWVALVLEDVEGRRPEVPWQPDGLEPTAATLERVAATRAPETLPPFADLVHAVTAWDEVAADPDGIDSSVLARLPELLRQQQLAREVTRGDALVHWDARADNILVRDGEAVLLDWAWACRGAPWLDTLLLAMDLRVQGGPDADGFLRSHPVTRDVEPAHLAAVVACMVGIWLERARRPSPPGLPTIRAWQAHCGAIALEWLDHGTLWT